MKFPLFLSNFLADHFRIAAGAVALIVLGLGYAFVLSARVATIQQTAVGEKQLAQAELKTEQRYAEDLEAAVAKYRTIFTEERLQRLNDFIPTTPDFPGLLLTLKAIAASADLTLDAVNVGLVSEAAVDSSTTATTAPKAAGPAGLQLRTQDASIVVSGGTSYEGFKKFIAILENSQRLFDVISLTFNQGAVGQDGSTSGSQYTVVVRTYYLPDASTTTP